MMEKIINYFGTEECRFANKALDFMDGKQLTHMASLLSDTNRGRKNWQERGMAALYRNLTGNIVSKSGLLFINGRPELAIETNEATNDVATEYFHDLLDDADFASVSENLDQVLRLLKTAVVLTQYDSEEDCLYLDILHKGNCYVKTSGNKKVITMLVHTTDYDHYKYAEDSKAYRVFTPEAIQDWIVEPQKKPEMIDNQPNPYGMVPANVFYDTTTPRAGFWNNIPRDLVAYNEEYNLYLTDITYAASFSNRKTLFTNASFSGDSDLGNSSQTQEVYNSPLPRFSQNDMSTISGPDRIVQLDSTGVDNVFLDYKGPDIRLDEIRKLFETLTRDYAADWSVRIKIEGEGTASSGFQVVVEEMNNLELRKQRQRLMEMGLYNMFDTVKTVINTAQGRTIFPEDAKLSIEFPDPQLPTDVKYEDDLWVQRIEKGLATRIDYLMYMKDLSADEAAEKIELMKINGEYPITVEEHKALLDAYLSGAISHSTYLKRLQWSGLVDDITSEQSLTEVSSFNDGLDE